MIILRLSGKYSVCKLNTITALPKTPYFLSSTDKELSLVCKTEDAPNCTRQDGWTGFRLEGTFDFSLVGIISKISGILAKNQIPIFVISTFDTDYFFVNTEFAEKTVAVLEANGYLFVQE